MSRSQKTNIVYHKETYTRMTVGLGKRHTKGKNGPCVMWTLQR